MGMNFKRKLPSPSEIRELYPPSEEVLKTKAERDKQIIDVFTVLALRTRKNLLWIM